MIISTKGFVLQTIKYSDHSLIVKIFTKKSGTVSFIIKNAFNKKSKQPANYFTPLSILNLNYNETYSEKLTFLKEVTMAYPYHSIPLDIRKNTLLLFYQELLSKLLFQANAPDEPLYDFIEEYLIQLETTPRLSSDFHIVFLVQLIQNLGYTPELNFSIQTPSFSIEDSNFVAHNVESSLFLSKDAGFYFYNILKKNNYEIPNKNIRMELLNGLLLYIMKYHKHIKEIESVGILSEILR
ncbi:MAG: DNA repair protein RecO [Dysgonamonadaceae bacterium]|jgi:DNA repair protein RecO (recombination protein O)|nr:DNA repair protein RecO [Dysgonamonadaceae bacterium]